MRPPREEVVVGDRTIAVAVEHKHRVLVLLYKARRAGEWQTWLERRGVFPVVAREVCSSGVRGLRGAQRA